MTFKDGGAFDFHSRFERIKERLTQAVDVARESGQQAPNGNGSGGGRGGGGDYNGVNLDNVNLDELPAYSEMGQTVPVPIAEPPSAAAEASTHATLGAAPAERRSSSTATSSPHQEVFNPPEDPPPGYEEAQREVVSSELERRLRSGELNERDG